jgi:hypothetical protein
MFARGLGKAKQVINAYVVVIDGIIEIDNLLLGSNFPLIHHFITLSFSSLLSPIM